MLLVFLSVCLGLSSAQILQDGRCEPNLRLQNDFNLENFTGRWYSLRGVSPLQNGDCSYIDIEPSSDNYEYQLHMRYVDLNGPKDTTGIAVALGSSASFNLTLESERIDFNVLSTDYESYALAYSCENVGESQRNVYVWQLARDTSFSDEAITSLVDRDIFANFGLTAADLTVTKHSKACFTLLTGQPVILPGQCNENIPAQANFDLERFQGVWILNASYYNERQSGTCNRARYTVQGNSLSILNSHIVDRQLLTVSGTATFASNDGSGKLLATVGTASRDFWILDTDYDNYALAYSCQNLNNNQQRVLSWKLSRTGSLTTQAITNIDRVINNVAALNNDYYTKADQSEAGCFYYPILQPNEPVILPGQCNQTIAAVPNFNLQRFQGEWRLNSSYYNERQSGTCNRARYTVQGNSLSILNSHIVDRQLLTVSGTATFASNDGSGKLLATVGTASRDFWILDTDYDNYALAYSCQNLNNNQQRVLSWKLSRTGSLTTQAITNIDRVINNVAALNNDYYTKADQSEAGCFYYPILQPNEPVILPGQCNQTIAAVPNFNLQRFQGEWRLNSSYYNERQSGTCNRARYTVQGNSLSILNSHIVDRQLLTVSGTATFASNDGSGKLVATVGTASRDFWILDTDYDTYALAYSCQNLNNNQQRVLSWKLSRTGSLTTQAITNINRVINNVAALNNDYYTKADQSEAGCFYYPILQPNEPVILPGQCNQTIAAVPNFNLQRFQGEWRLNASYYNERQSGTCNRARYTAQGNSLSILNSHIVDRQLLTVSGTATFASNDGSGKLLATVGTASRDFWILDTDYDNYALAYSCQNLNNNQQRVLSWKLSRTGSLTTQAITNINRVINNVAALNNDYYTKADQSEAGCFYYPILQPNEPVILPGQCNQTIAAVPNFNLQRFQGEWRLNSSYYNKRQSGTCNRARYTVQGNSLSILNSHIVDRQLLTVSGTATFASNDGSGKLVATVGTASRDFWILDTDYDTYALAYSCQNLNNNQQRVLSWKLSRTGSLTTQAITNINRVINNVAALNNDYYTKADQSEAGCFYYPILQPNEPVILPGQCNQTIAAVPNFNLQRFQGEWRLNASYYNERQSGTCNRARYTAQGNSLSILNSHIVDRQLLTVSGTATFASNDGSGKLLATVGTASRDFWILDTDYDNYALAYSCQNLNNNQQRVLSWKLSRTGSLTTQAITNINRVINNVAALNNDYYTKADQSEAGCFYYPILQPNEPVILPGQCNQTIAAVPNFNLQRFQGEWRLNASYYNERQSGTCNRARYTVQGNSLSILNSHIVDRQLLTVSGTATFASNDGSGKLLATVGLASRDFWILDTDYDNYALAYSCQNLNNNQQRVLSWKLSRTGSLTTQAITNIDRVINNVAALNNDYYTKADQSEAGCFYYPILQPNEPVILPGQCNQTIAAVPNFNLQRFQGEWRLNSSYYNERQSGTCNRARYTVQGNSLSILNSHIVDRQLLTVSGTATFASNDGSGKLLATVGTASRDFWILDTDYDNYALAYSCQNLNNNQQRVLSWKLSRTGSLTTQAITNINRVINNVAALNNDYYTKANQSEAGCFYYPNLEPNEPVIFPGQCDNNIPVVPNFNLDSFLGRWRLIESYFSHRQSGTCNQADYSRDGNIIRVRNMHVLNSQLSTVSGTLTEAADRSGKLSISISVRTVDFWILATDYDNYALAYSCSNVNANQKRIYTWKLSRTTSLTPESQAAINGVIAKIDVLDQRYYQAANQSPSGCFYYPPVDANQTVIFPGQCDQNIPVVENFDLNRYLNVWYDVESYPSSFQYGTCNTARYAQRGNDMLIVNTQIVNAALSTREAVGVFTEGNRVAKLRVNFGSQDRDYWVLSTDYTSYALVYSCMNIDANSKQVGTWKMSRTSKLTNAANTAINQVMENIRELDQRYFVIRNHTDAGCFYHREQPESSIIFSGQCDLSVQAVPNFNLTAFQGVWHEIETYPSEMLTGECMSQEYTQGTGSSLNLVQRNVQYETLFDRNATITQTSTDNSGQLTITIQDAFGVTIPFWILSTNYNDYALAYGCVNLNANERQVYSWKLSRSKQLSAAARAAINAVKSSVAVLDSRYYKSVNQSDSACFYLPDIGPEETVILPGQCDVNIPVVRNFDVQRYSGTWYQIEKYYQRFEGGNCTGARYTLNSNTGVVTVLNWQVVDGVLDTIQGTATVNSTDGSAKLLVRLPIRSSDVNNPQFREMNLYVLDTDYTSYSLVYSCVNVDSNRRAIGAWKLSRDRTMSEAGNNAINTYMANRQELQSSYFIAVNQSDSCPEPSSATLLKNSIIMLVILSVSLLYLS